VILIPLEHRSKGQRHDGPQVCFAQQLSRDVFVNVVNDSLPTFLELESTRDELRIVEMIQIGVNLETLLVETPWRRGDPPISWPGKSAYVSNFDPVLCFDALPVTHYQADSISGVC
jgi:hypothetical protein